MQVIRAHGCSSRSVASGNSSGSSVRRPIRGGEQLLGSSNGGLMSGLQERSTISKVSHICRVAMESPADGAAAAPGAWAVPDAATTDKRAHCASAAAEPRTEFDVLGIGQVMVDYAAAVDESLLNRLGVSKGGRRVINVEERGTALELLAGCDSVVSAGGSLANTLVGMSRLAAAQARAADKDVVAPHMQPRVAMAGCVGGGDALGEFARAQLGAAGVAVAGSASPPGGPTDGATGVVMVLTTPDAQRSFLSSFSPDDALTASPELLTAVADSRLLLLEGYLWELPGAQAALPALLDAATAARHSGNGHASGSAASNGSNAAGLVALTAGDASVIARHGAAVLGALTRGVDLFLANADEALALVQHLDCLQEQAANVTSHENAAHSGSASTTLAAAAAAAADPEMIECLERLGSASLDDDIVSGGEQVASFVGGVAAVDVPAAAAALRLATLCPLVAVTDGAHGSYIAAAGGRLLVVPPYWRAAPPRDTCGAGDAYAAGLLHGLLQGLELPAAGQLAARTASAVISRHGPQLTADDADWALMMPGGARRTAASGVVVAGGGCTTQPWWARPADQRCRHCCLEAWPRQC